jgi:putative endonuclease
MQCFFAYIMSNRSHTLYIGMTTDVTRRAREHKDRKYPNAFTARYTFDRLVYFEAHPTQQAAEARERQLKSWSRLRKVALVQEKNPNWLDLSVSYTDALRLD